MAVIAIITACYMRRMLAGRRGAVVTGTACSQDLGVVDRYGRLESGRVVAVFADIGGLNVGRAFASCCRTVVAAHAISDDASMIKYGGKPCAHGMAVVTLVVG